MNTNHPIPSKLLNEHLARVSAQLFDPDDEGSSSSDDSFI